MKNLMIIGLLFCGWSMMAQQKIPSKEAQLKSAVLAAPESYRADATVMGYDANGVLITLKKGTNEMICLADDPAQKGISIACYSDKLEPFMKRGRELVAEGKDTKGKRTVRQKEIEEGILEMPTEPAAVYVLSAEEGDFNLETGEIENFKVRFVLYKPYMTVEETGLPDKPHGKGTPWLMDAGTHRSHIMITP